MTIKIKINKPKSWRKYLVDYFLPRAIAYSSGIIIWLIINAYLLGQSTTTLFWIVFGSFFTGTIVESMLNYWFPYEEYEEEEESE